MRLGDLDTLKEEFDFIADKYGIGEKKYISIKDIKMIIDKAPTFVSTEGDLISRSAFKEAIETWDKFACLPNGKLEPFRNLEHPEMFVPYIHFDDVIKAIDNSPTVTIDNYALLAEQGHEFGNIFGDCKPTFESAIREE